MGRPRRERLQPGARGTTGSPPLLTPRPESAARTSGRRAVRTAREAAPRSLGLPARVGTRCSCSCAPRVSVRRAHCQDRTSSRAGEPGPAPASRWGGAGRSVLQAPSEGALLGIRAARLAWGLGERAAYKIFPRMGSPASRQTGSGKQAARTFQGTGSPETSWQPPAPAK